MNRRNFLRMSSLGSLALALRPPAFALAANNPYRKAMGIQLYTLRDALGKDTVGTLKAVAEAGYKQVEPYGFPHAGPMIQAAKDLGMAVHSSHFDWESVTNPTKEGVMPFAKILDAAKGAGLSHLVVPYLHSHERKNMDDYKRLADQMNKAAVEAKTAGITLAYHNHAFEFEPQADGSCGYDIFVERFGPDMHFEIDVFWVKVANIEPLDLMKKLKGRVTQLHLKDLLAGVKLPSYAGVGKEAFKELGAGIIPMEPIIEAAAEIGVAHCHVEQDHSPAPLTSIQTSMKYLNTL